MYFNIIFSVGKTTFAYNLVKHQHFTTKIKTVHYFGSGAKYLDQRLDWHRKLKKVAVNYHGKDILTKETHVDLNVKMAYQHLHFLDLSRKTHWLS